MTARASQRLRVRCEDIFFVPSLGPARSLEVDQVLCFSLEGVEGKWRRQRAASMWPMDLPQWEMCDRVWDTTVTILWSFPIYMLFNSRAREWGEETMFVRGDHVCGQHQVSGLVTLLLKTNK